MSNTQVSIYRAVIHERELCARIAESFAKEYGAEVGKMAYRIAEVIRMQPPPSSTSRETAQSAATGDVPA